MLSKFKKLISHKKKDKLVKEEQFMKKSYSQCGEDLIIDFYFSQYNILLPSYLDIGAHHPFNMNNTYLFYQRGAKGVNIEPDPMLISQFTQLRPLDTNLNVGITVDNNSTATFYQMSANSLNTFSQSEANRIADMGTYSIIKEFRVDTLRIKDVVESYFSEKSLDLLTIDAEGMDYDILQDMFMQNIRPKVVCAETLIYEESEKKTKRSNLIELMKANNYNVYGDTFINTIFNDEGI